MKICDDAGGRRPRTTRRRSRKWRRAGEAAASASALEALPVEQPEALELAYFEWPYPAGDRHPDRRGARHREDPRAARDCRRWTSCSPRGSCDEPRPVSRGGRALRGPLALAGRDGESATRSCARTPTRSAERRSGARSGPGLQLGMSIDPVKPGRAQLGPRSCARSAGGESGDVSTRAASRWRERDGAGRWRRARCFAVGSRSRGAGKLPCSAPSKLSRTRLSARCASKNLAARSQRDRRWPTCAPSGEACARALSVRARATRRRRRSRCRSSRRRARKIAWARAAGGRAPAGHGAARSRGTPRGPGRLRDGGRRGKGLRSCGSSATARRSGQGSSIPTRAAAAILALDQSPLAGKIDAVAITLEPAGGVRRSRLGRDLARRCAEGLARFP